MKRKMKILVSGCGGDIGQSVGKILGESSYVSSLFGCDISDKNAARFIYENFFLAPAITDSDYMKTIETVIQEKNIDIFIPVSEPELRFFFGINRLDNIGGAKILMASEKALEVGFDKLKTAEFLKQKGLPYPVTQELTTAEAENIDNFPVIVKSRTGSGSSKVDVVQSSRTLKDLSGNNSDCIVQEYLDGTRGEFTCGLFRSTGGIIRTIIFKRELHGSYSGYGEVIKNNDIRDLLIKVAEELELVGSINVQLRLTSRGPTVFEINPRFSSTVLFRHLLGFKDLEWSIEDSINLHISDYIDNSAGKKFFKGFEEYIL